jgi:ribonuclease HII
MDLLAPANDPGGLCAGVDEVGRGPLAGPVVAAAVILHPLAPIDGLRDSKRLSAAQRETLYEEIRKHAIAIGVGRAEPAEIDRMNILRATLLAMQRAVAMLAVRPDVVYVDGNVTPVFGVPAVAIIGGDDLHAAISAASIIAKVLRDREMHDAALQYPEYGFERHKGYATATHLGALAEFGPTPIHRKTFAPLRGGNGPETQSLFDAP